jgi:Fe-S-cluster containining protein
MIKDFKCKQCGLCCKYLSDAFCVTTYQEDLANWEKNSDFDILKRTLQIYIGNDKYIHDIWFRPDTKELYPYCPWLRRVKGNKYKYYCKIQDKKPQHCKNYPIDRKQALTLACPGIIPKNSKEKEIRRLGGASLSMDNVQYKGFLAKVDYSKNSGVFKVNVFNIDSISQEQYKYLDKDIKMRFKTSDPVNLEKEFHALVNNYLKNKNK